MGMGTWGHCGAVMGLGMGAWGASWGCHGAGGGDGDMGALWSCHGVGDILGTSLGWRQDMGALWGCHGAGDGDMGPSWGWGHPRDVGTSQGWADCRAMGTSWSHHGVWGHPRAMGTRWGWGDRGDVGTFWGHHGDVVGMGTSQGRGDILGLGTWRHDGGTVGLGTWGCHGVMWGVGLDGRRVGTSEGGGGQPGGVGDHWDVGMCPPTPPPPPSPGLGSPMEPCCPHGFGVTTMAAIPGGGHTAPQMWDGGSRTSPPPHTLNAVTVVTPDPPPNDIR